MLSCRGGAGGLIRANCALLRANFRDTGCSAPHNPVLHISRGVGAVCEWAGSGGSGIQRSDRDVQVGENERHPRDASGRAAERSG